MTAQMIEGTEVRRPQPAPLNSTILDHATVVDNPKFGLRNNEGLWVSYNCLDLLVPTPTCARPEIEMDYKEFVVAPWVPGFEFGVHGGVKCSAVGLDTADQQAEVERVFERSEARGVEQALLFNRFVENEGPGSDDPVSPYGATWDAPVDISQSGMNLVAAMAALESYAAGIYAGLPTLHMSRGAVLAAFGQGLITERDGKFFTKTGAKVAAGGGYDDPDRTFDGTFDIYATGEVYVERSTKLSFNNYVLPGDGSGTGSGENGLGDNEHIALVERMFRVAIDCFSAKATASIAGGGSGSGGFGD